MIYRFDAVLRDSACFAALSLMLVACGDDGSTGQTSDNGSTSSTTVSETTIPVTVSDTAAETSVSASNTTDGSSTTDSTTDSTTTSTTTDTDTGNGTSTGDGTTGGLDPVTVEWCILQYPPTIPVPMSMDPVAPNEATTVYTRFYIPTVTDQTVFNDTDSRVVVEAGYGADGSDPAMANWDWSSMMPNPGWDGSMAMGGFGNENNDEYQGDLSFSAAGTYDYATRISGDGGETWVYCDLDGLAVGGYTSDQAGDATITN
jgi:hypothetical protein